VKVKMLSWNLDNYVHKTPLDLQIVPRNYDPTLHPFEVLQEYVRVLNATKLEGVFAKPFLAWLDGHRNGVSCLAKHPKSLATVLSGLCDGEVRIWNLTQLKCICIIQAHEGFVRGICTRFCGTSFHSITYNIRKDRRAITYNIRKDTGIDHHWKEAVFQLDIWGEQRTNPICSMTWRFDSISSGKFNAIETFILESCMSNRNIVLYDMKQATPLKKVILDMRTNTICWNPMEAFIFMAANDYNLFTFDMCALDTPVMVHMDHVSAVLDVDYSPTGKEFVFQHVLCVKWTSDSKYIMYGSDEMSIHLWKANASEKLGVLTSQEKAAKYYNQKLKEKFQNHPHIQPTEVNHIKHSKPGSVPVVSKKKKHIVPVVKYLVFLTILMYNYLLLLT
uniref:DDB1- and CUL4-associated factor 13 n=1 Tax=Colobus angolensis palliatus TaxID=336983 RepID=A0A2K5JN96_COLAP